MTLFILVANSPIFPFIVYLDNILFFKIQFFFFYFKFCISFTNNLI